MRTLFGPPGVLSASSREDTRWEKELLHDNFSYVPYVPPHELHLDVVFNYDLIAANVAADLPAYHNISEDLPEYVEIAYESNMWQILPDVPRPPEKGEIVVERIYHNSKRIVNVERDDDILTPEETIKHKDEIHAAMLKELITWAKMKCFSRRKRATAKNTIDCRWVLKWKIEEDTTSVDKSAAGLVSKKRRVIRARLTVRGFKDLDKGFVATYAGTSQRYSQRIIVSEAVLRNWDIATTDISKAFLQGVTYKELAALTGEPERDVNFYLPAYNIPQLQQVPGYESFDPNTEVLHCDKPGTGSVDAPRCFSLKLSKVTQSIGLVSSNVDPEFCYLHEEHDGKLTLVCMMTKHVDDLKVAGKRDVVLRVLKAIEDVFGEMKISWNNFTNCGVRHMQDLTTKEASLDQTEYISGLKTIPVECYRGLSNSSKCDSALHLKYMSLLGAVAFAALTRVDAAVFIVGLQRHSHAPDVHHVKRLNVLTRWMQANPRKLKYCRLDISIGQHMKIIADSSFKKEEEKGHSLRGVLLCRCEGLCFTKGGKVHLLDFATKALRFVTRSTFSAELLGACDSFDLGLMILFILNEIQTGVPTKADARKLREEGGWTIPAALCIDALSVHAAVTATYIKPPAEKGLLAHIQYLRELLDNHVLEVLMWMDTRDMTADGLTKGSVERLALHLLMSGEIKIDHPPRPWKSLI